MLELAVQNRKSQIVLGLEPTGHYWFALAAWLITAGISVVQVNPYAVKQSKEIEDNSQLKDDRKDPKLIANLVKDGNYGMPYLPEEIYADMRRLSMFRDQLTEDRIRNINRLHRELKIYFPEYMDALGTECTNWKKELTSSQLFSQLLTAYGYFFPNFSFMFSSSVKAAVSFGALYTSLKSEENFFRSLQFTYLKELRSIWITHLWISACG